MSGDPHWNSVVLLALNDNAANGTTTFADQSSFARSLTRFGNAIYSNAQAPTGMTTSVAFDGNGDKVKAGDSSDFGFGSGNATIEFMQWRTNGSGAIFWDMRVNSTNGIMGAANDVKTTLTDSALDKIVAAGIAHSTWMHVAWVRVSSVWTLYTGGVGFGTTYTDSGMVSTTPFNIGGGFEASGFSSWNGYLSNVRVTKGVARYTSNFTPPSLPFPVGLPPTGGPFPHYTRRHLTGGLIRMKERVRRFISLPSGILAPKPGLILPQGC